MSAPPLPILSTVIDAYRFVWDGRRVFILTAALPVVVLSLAGIGLSLLPQQGLIQLDMPDRAEPVSALSVQDLAGSLISLLAYTMFAVAWHRKWLVGPEGITIWTALRWDQRKSRFLLRLIGIGVICTLSVFPMTLVLGILGSGMQAILPFAALAISALAGLIFARLVPVLPAAAVDDPMTFRDAWGLVTGNNWRVLLICILPQLPISLLATMLVLLMAGLLGGLGLGGTLTGTLALNLMTETVSYFGIAVGVTALSITYRHLTQGARGAQGQST